MAWVDSGVAVMRSRIHAGTWVPVLDGSSEDVLLNAGPLRLVQAFVVEQHTEAGRTRWRKLNDDLYVLDEWVTA